MLICCGFLCSNKIVGSPNGGTGDMAVSQVGSGPCCLTHASPGGLEGSWAESDI